MKQDYQLENSQHLGLVNQINHQFSGQAVVNQPIQYPLDYEQTKKTFYVWLVFAFVAFILSIIVKAMAVFNLDIVQELIGIFVISINICYIFAHNLLKEFSCFNVWHGASYVMGPFVFLMLRWPYAGYFYLFLGLILIIAICLREKFSLFTMILISFVCSIGVILFRFDGVIDWNWSTILPVSQFIVLGIFIKFFYQLSSMFLRKNDIVALVKLMGKIGFLSILLSPFTISFFWIFTPSYLHHFLFVNIFLHFSYVLLGCYYAKQISYVYCKNIPFQIKERLTQTTFTKLYLEPQKRCQLKGLMSCIRCQKQNATMLAGKCFHLCFCFDCLSKSNKEVCPICETRGSFNRVCFSKHAQNSQFKIVFFRDYQFKVYPL